VFDEIFSMPFGYFAVENIPKLNYCSTLVAPDYVTYAESPINRSLMLKINHAEAFPKKKLGKFC